MKLFAAKSYIESYIAAISKLQKYCQEYSGISLPSALWAKCVSIILSIILSKFESS